jgi:hypothetical protein
MMDGSIFHLLEVIYAKTVACKVQKIHNERCCGCKVYKQDCLMMDEHETWEIHGLNAIEQANNTSSIWNEFTAAIKILNIENHKDFTQHLMCLQEEPDQNFVYTLLRIYQDNQPLLRILHDLWNPQTDPLESYAQCNFSSPPHTLIMSKGQRKHSNLSKRITRKRIRNI